MCWYICYIILMLITEIIEGLIDEFMGGANFKFIDEFIE